MKILLLNCWGQDSSLAVASEGVRKLRLFEWLSRKSPDVLLLQECTPDILRHLLNQGYQIAMGLMDRPDNLVIPACESDISRLGYAFSVAVASKVGLRNPRTVVYSPGKHWMPEKVVEWGEAAKRMGIRTLNGNLNPVIVYAEVCGLTLACTHFPTGISRDPRSATDSVPGTPPLQRKYLDEMIEVIEAHGLRFDVFGADSNTHSVFYDSVFQKLKRRYGYQLAADPTKFASMDPKLFPKRDKPFAKFVSPDNIAYQATKLRVLSWEELTGVSDHKGLFVKFLRLG